MPIIHSLRRSPLVIAFWVACIAAIAIVWKLMPTTGSQIALIILLALVVISTLFHQTELPILTTVFLGLLSVCYWQSKHPGLQIVSTSATAVLVPTLGLVGEKINRAFQAVEDDQLVSHWLILGLISAEAVSVFNNWPVSFFNRALLSAIFFYTFWQLFHIQHGAEKKSIIAHFVFVALTVIVVVGIILWLNFLHPTS